MEFRAQLRDPGNDDWSWPLLTAEATPRAAAGGPNRSGEPRIVDGRPLRRFRRATMALVATGILITPGDAVAVNVADALSSTSPVTGAIVEHARPRPRGILVTRIVVLDGATTTVSATQSPRVATIRVAYLSVLACGSKHGRPAGCRTVTSHAYDLEEDSFTIDPLLRSAALDVGRGRRRLVVSWEGRSEISTSTTRWRHLLTGDPAAGDVWWEAEAEMGVWWTRDAKSAATVGNRSLRGLRHSTAWVFRGTGAYAGHSACLLEALAPC